MYGYDQFWICFRLNAPFVLLGLVSIYICMIYTGLAKRQFDIAHLCVFVFNIPPTAKVICRLDHGFMSI